jgi:hypothetical protein
VANALLAGKGCAHTSSCRAALTCLVNLVTLSEVIAQLVGASEGHSAAVERADEPGRAVLQHVATAVTSTTEGLAATRRGAVDTIAGGRWERRDGG